MEGELIGVLGFDAIFETRNWKEDEISLLKITGEIFSNAFERKLNEEKLEASEKKLLSVLNTVGEGIITINVKSEIIMVNDEITKIFGYNKEELIGKDVSILMPDGFANQHHNGMKRYMHTKKSDILGTQIELSARRKSGKVFPIQIKIQETLIGKNRYFTAAIHDITDTKKLVSDLKMSNKALTEFAYIASHDLREPLRKITSFGSLLKRTSASKLNEDEQENLDFMIDGANRMQDMIDDLLTYSRITSSISTDSKCDVDEIIKELMEFELASLIEESKTTVKILNKIGKIKSERFHIKQLMQNLLGNAIKYRRENTEHTVEISSHIEEWYLKIQIKDNGIGFDNNFSSQIFEMFKRLHSGDKYQGSGIGLSVCKKIVTIYNGEIGADSQVNKGSTFWFKLPIAGN